MSRSLFLAIGHRVAAALFGLLFGMTMAEVWSAPGPHCCPRQGHPAIVTPVVATPAGPLVPIEVVEAPAPEAEVVPFEVGRVIDLEGGVRAEIFEIASETDELQVELVAAELSRAPEWLTPGRRIHLVPASGQGVLHYNLRLETGPEGLPAAPGVRVWATLAWHDLFRIVVMSQMEGIAAIPSPDPEPAPGLIPPGVQWTVAGQGE
ncbi:MAG: hypothetical protein P1V51_00775 [Deltaproteobacteria bacterium]|nr:hypothetical protein [Deltaproteobacteria bacterium]